MIAAEDQVTVVMVGGPFDGRQQTVPYQQWLDYHSECWCFERDGDWSHYRGGALVEGVSRYAYAGRCRHGLFEKQPAELDNA